LIDITQAESAWDSSDSVLSYALDGIAKDVQTRIRSRIDTGIGGSSAIRASSVKVRAEDGRLVIKSDPQMDEGEDTSINDLFGTRTPVPYIEDNKLIFRRINEEQTKRRVNNVVVGSVTEALGLSFDKHLRESVSRVVSENPRIRR
jgi:hypothetical protein